MQILKSHSFGIGETSSANLTPSKTPTDIPAKTCLISILRPDKHPPQSPSRRGSGRPEVRRCVFVVVAVAVAVLVAVSVPVAVAVAAVAVSPCRLRARDPLLTH